MAISNEQKIKLAQIELARKKVDYYIKNGTITEEDIINLAFQDKDYGIINPIKERHKESILKDIYNCPFLLCDQELSLLIKKMLPTFLQSRYEMEINELEYQYELCFITKEEFEKTKKMLEFCYYRSSIEGKEIKKNGKVKDVVDNVIRLHLVG